VENPLQGKPPGPYCLGREFAKVSVANYHRAPGPSSSSCPYSPKCPEGTNLLKNSFTSSSDAYLAAESAVFGRFELG
jgi:hypothetical protein